MILAAPIPYSLLDSTVIVVMAVGDLLTVATSQVEILF